MQRNKYSKEEEDLVIAALKGGDSYTGGSVEFIDVQCAESLYKRAFGAPPEITQTSPSQRGDYFIERMLDAIVTGVPCNDPPLENGVLL